MLSLQRRHVTDYIMARKEIYEARLAELGWTEYRLAQEIVEIRKSRGETTTLKGIYSSITQTLKEPERRSTYINDDIVAALGGENVIRWTQTVDIKL
jgi:hypothetical protein